jgi:glycerophosphoryl diester phosphodiesterase
MAQLIAHRGRSACAPENTMAAFEAALAAGFTWIETDVDLLADGTPALLHDGTLDRTTDGAGPLAALERPELQEHDAGSWFSAAFSSERVPLLSDLTGLMARTGLCANLELKLSDPAPQRVEQLLEAVAGEMEGLAAKEGSPGVVISSFDHELLARLRERTGPAASLAPLLEPGALAGSWRRAADATGADRVHPHHADLTPRLADELHEAGLRIAAWTINDPERARALAGWGVEGICTDGPPGMTPADWGGSGAPTGGPPAG